MLLVTPGSTEERSPSQEPIHQNEASPEAQKSDPSKDLQISTPGAALSSGPDSQLRALEKSNEFLPSFIIPGSEKIGVINIKDAGTVPDTHKTPLYLVETLGTDAAHSVEKCLNNVAGLVECNLRRAQAGLGKVIALEVNLAQGVQSDARLLDNIERIANGLAGHQLIVFINPHNFTAEKLADVARKLNELNCNQFGPTFGIKTDGILPSGEQNPHLSEFARLSAKYELPLRMSVVRSENPFFVARLNDVVNTRAAITFARALDVPPEQLLELLKGSDHERAIDAKQLKPALPAAGTSPKPHTEYPLGAAVEKSGVHFSLLSKHATGVELCLFNSTADSREFVRIPLTGKDGRWDVFVPGLKAGQLYAYRIDGAYDPANSLYFNKNRIIVDPYAKAIARDVREWNPELHVSRDPKHDKTNNADKAPLSVVIDDTFDWGDDKRPVFNASEAVVIELNVRGTSILHPKVPEKERGTFAGLASDAMIKELKGLGNTVELLPPAAGATEGHLAQHNLKNLWNYNTVAFMAPDPRYCASTDPVDQVREFKEMVKKLHAEGFKVVVDVVFNHTAEGNPNGPTLCLRGLDRDYYLTFPGGQYIDYTGCGNTLNMDYEPSLKLVIDSLRYWVNELHVDGFRFDEAPVLAVENHNYNPDSRFFQAIENDPVLRDCILISESWSVGPPGQQYQLGNFPKRWGEWNGKFRDEIRSFWRGTGSVAELATRMFGSSDLFQHAGRTPQSSVNFLTAHDGFTLNDLWSYDHKHNLANKEGNRDGIDNNVSWNCGVEGPTGDPEVNRVRLRLQRASMATLMLSAGTPMICLGDAILHSQGGNNNAYCQDNAIGWLNWSLDQRQSEFKDYIKGLYELRMAQPVLRRTTYEGNRLHDGAKEVTWICSTGKEMTEQDWKYPHAKTLGVCLSNKWVEGADKGDSLFIVSNAYSDSLPFVLPQMPGEAGGTWKVVMDTSADKPFAEGADLQPGRAFTLKDRCVMVMKYVPKKP